MSEQEVRDLWSAVDMLRAKINDQNVLLAEIKTLLTERHSSLRKDLDCIEAERKCEVHAQKINTLERMIWALWVGVAGLFSKLVYDFLKR